MSDDLEDFTEMLAHLERASRETHGIALEFDTPEAVVAYRQKLYKVRREVGGYEFLSFVQHDNELWIAHNARRET
jgi:hypothetical protein